MNISGKWKAAAYLLTAWLFFLIAHILLLVDWGESIVFQFFPPFFFFFGLMVLWFVFIVFSSSSLVKNNGWGVTLAMFTLGIQISVGFQLSPIFQLIAIAVVFLLRGG